jgi:hypothetical protein
VYVSLGSVAAKKTFPLMLLKFLLFFDGDICDIFMLVLMDESLVFDESRRECWMLDS